MKKIINLLLTLILIFSTSIVFAKTYTSGDEIVSGDSFSPSKGVYIIIKSDTSAYSAASYHKQGVHWYGTTHETDIQSATCYDDGSVCGESYSITISEAGKFPTSGSGTSDNNTEEDNSTK